MRNSEHFNLFLAEGSDIVNPLVQDVGNYEAIDSQMFKNQNAGVQNATELKSGTVHAITRNVPDAQFITFTATSNYTAGETFTVDGVQVSALTVGGETLPTGAYVINSQVLCVLKGTLLTVYGVGTEVADNSLALNGHPDTYFGTKEEVDNAIDTANAANVLANEVNNSFNTYKNKINIAVTRVTASVLECVADYKSGIVTIRGYTWTGTSGTQKTAILTIPKDYAPKNCAIQKAGGLTNNGEDIIGYGIATLTPDGKLNITYSTNVGFVFFDFCYAI